MDDPTNFQRNFSTGEVEVEGSTIYHKTEYRERRDHYAVYTVNAPVDGFDTSRDAFLGACAQQCQPRSGRKGCVHQLRRPRLGTGRRTPNQRNARPRREPQLNLLCWATSRTRSEEKWAAPGVIEQDAAPMSMLARYATDAQVDEALAAAARPLERACCPPIAVRSSDEKLDRMVNIWNQYQCMVTFNMSRSACLLRERHRPWHGLP